MSEEKKPKIMPSVCTWHDEDEYTIEIDLPGVSKKDVDVGVTATGFCVIGPRKDLVYSSCYTLAHAIDPDKAKAKFENGLLILTLPFKEQPAGKKLVVE
jgi:HSP20 family molecular chaperone IbpA